MKASDIPSKFPIPFAENAGASFKRAIPTTTPDPAAASLDLGFPPATATPVAAGGTPPNIADENGILYVISAWARWMQAGDVPVPFDAVFSAAIGGYPKGARVASATNFGLFWYSLIDDNTSDPDAAGAGWASFVPTNLYADDTGVTNAYVCAFSPPQAIAIIGQPLYVKIANSNTGASTLNAGAGIKQVCRRDGSALIGGELAGIIKFAWNGTKYQVDGVAPASDTVSLAGIDALSAVTPASLLSVFNPTKATPGYVRMPGGLILQWDYVVSQPSGTTTYNFPVAFPNNCLIILAAYGYALGGGVGAIGANPISPSQFNVKNSDSFGHGFNWLAIGW